MWRSSPAHSWHTRRHSRRWWWTLWISWYATTSGWRVSVFGHTSRINAIKSQQRQKYGLSLGRQVRLGDCICIVHVQYDRWWYRVHVWRISGRIRYVFWRRQRKSRMGRKLSQWCLFKCRYQLAIQLVFPLTFERQRNDDKQKRKLLQVPLCLRWPINMDVVLCALPEV